MAPSTSIPIGMATAYSMRVKPAEARAGRRLKVVILHSIFGNVEGHSPAALDLAGRPFDFDIHYPHIILVIRGECRLGNIDGAGIDDARRVRGIRTIRGREFVRYPVLGEHLIPGENAENL